MKICENCKKQIQGLPCFFKGKLLCGLCFWKRKNRGASVLRLETAKKFFAEKYTNVIALQKTKKRFAKIRRRRKEFLKNKKIKMPRLSAETKDRIQYLLHNGLVRNGFCNLCSKKLIGKKKLWCGQTCNSRFDAEKIKLKTFIKSQDFL